jgi:hypothetical protein
MKSLGLLLILSITLIGCGVNTTDFSKPKSPTASVVPETKPTSSSIQKPPIADNFLISEEGIGFARLGMTLQQLKQKLGTEAKFEVVSPFMVDWDAIAVYQTGTVQYYILYPSGTTLSDSEKIELLLTNNPNYRTVEGVGTGTSLTQAEAIYGKAILSYNTQNESRELVRFTNYSPQNIIFQPTVPSRSFAGIYPSPSGEYNETKNFHDLAIIRSVFVGR